MWTSPYISQLKAVFYSFKSNLRGICCVRIYMGSSLQLQRLHPQAGNGPGQSRQMSCSQTGSVTKIIWDLKRDDGDRRRIIRLT